MPGSHHVAASEEMGAMSHPYHIVIAEDFDAVRTLLIRLIGNRYPNATISAVADGILAYDIIVRSGADLLIATTHLPVLDGPSLIRRLRRQQATIPILLLSSDPAMASVGAQAGADRFLLKPFT